MHENPINMLGRWVTIAPTMMDTTSIGNEILAKSDAFGGSIAIKHFHFVQVTINDVNEGTFDGNNTIHT